MRSLVCWCAFSLSTFFISIEVKCSILVLVAKFWLTPIHPLWLPHLSFNLSYYFSSRCSYHWKFKKKDQHLIMEYQGVIPQNYYNCFKVQHAKTHMILIVILQDLWIQMLVLQFVMITITLYQLIIRLLIVFIINIIILNIIFKSPGQLWIL
jgi:hypothetical protein